MQQFEAFWIKIPWLSAQLARVRPRRNSLSKICLHKAGVANSLKKQKKELPLTCGLIQ
jgi:hypothetical protein